MSLGRPGVAGVGGGRSFLASQWSEGDGPGTFQNPKPSLILDRRLKTIDIRTIVVRFMMESQEKEELVPVLARLLEFSPEELRKVKEARSKRNMSWTALVPGFG